MLRLAKVMLKRIVSIISASRLTDTQTSSCFLLIHMALDRFFFIILIILCCIVIVFFELYFVWFDTFFCDFRSSPKSNELFKNYISDILFYSRYCLKGTHLSKHKKYLWRLYHEKYLLLYRGGCRAATTSKMERFVIVNGFQLLITITKHSILDVAADLDPPLIYTLIMYLIIHVFL